MAECDRHINVHVCISFWALKHFSIQRLFSHRRDLSTVCTNEQMNECRKRENTCTHRWRPQRARAIRYGFFCRPFSVEVLTVFGKLCFEFSVQTVCSVCSGFFFKFLVYVFLYSNQNSRNVNDINVVVVFVCDCQI